MLRNGWKRLLCTVLVLAPLGAAGADPSPAGEVKRTVTGTVEIRQKTQQEEDRWAAEKAELEARYRAAKTQVSALEPQESLWTKKVEVLQEEVDGLSRRMEESERLEANLQAVLERILGRLSNRVEQDLPFLPEERKRRLDDLEETLARPDVSEAEKLRRVLEALLVECEYGHTVEVYQQEIEVAGQPVFVDVLRLGRVSIFWQTPDGKRTGEYDQGSNQWIELPATYNRSVYVAIEMASKRRPVELVKLPVGRIRP